MIFKDVIKCLFLMIWPGSRFDHFLDSLAKSQFLSVGKSKTSKRYSAINWPLGCAKVKSACCAKLTRFRKTTTILSAFIKIFWFFFVKGPTNRVLFYLNISFGNIFFWLAFGVLKINDHFQWPKGQYQLIQKASILLNLYGRQAVQCKLNLLLKFFFSVFCSKLSLRQTIT